MAERPAADAGTQEKKPDEGEDDPDGPNEPVDANPSPFSMIARFPDGYELIKDDSGDPYWGWYLATPEGDWGWWDPTSDKWVSWDKDGNITEMPDEWSHGHVAPHEPSDWDAAWKIGGGDEPAGTEPTPGDPAGTNTWTQQPEGVTPALQTPSAPRTPTGVKGWTGSATYPDGYTMERDASGTFTLTTPDGDSATWTPTSRGWVSNGGAPLPDGWDGGHTPSTQFKSGPGTARSH